MHRLFISSSQLQKTVLTLTDTQYHHVINVLHIKSNDGIELVDETKTVIHAIVKETTKTGLILYLKDNTIQAQNRQGKLILFQALPKGDKFSEIVRQCTEIGVSEIVPISTERCISKPDKTNNKQKRWATIAESAASQSKLTHIPIIHPITPLKEIKAYISDSALKIVFWEENKTPLYTVVGTEKHPEVAILIGPEGGLSEKEIDYLKENQFHPASLGPSILRVEHAAFAAINQLIGCQAF